MSAEPAVHLPFVKGTKGPKGAQRANFWNVRPSGDHLQDERTGRDLALAFMAHEHERIRDNPNAASIIGQIVHDMIDSRDRSAISSSFVATLVSCSAFTWSPPAIESFRKFYAEVEREVDECFQRSRRRPAQVSTP